MSGVQFLACWISLNESLMMKYTCITWMFFCLIWVKVQSHEISARCVLDIGLRGDGRAGTNKMHRVIKILLKLINCCIVH